MAEATFKRLQEKVALVTGAGDGIGRGIAVRFAREGAKVGVLDIRGAEDTASIIHSEDNQATALPCDLTEPQQVHDAIQILNDRYGTTDIVLNNAAIMPSGSLHETSLEDWDAVFDVNVRGAYLVNREVLPQMLSRKQGCILYMASVTGILGLPGLAAYSATKGALISLTRAMSTDYAPSGIRVNCIAPGTIDSPMLHNFLAEQSNPALLRKQFDEMHPVQRVGQIKEVASVCVFLASDEASFVTGAVYTVDGGLSVKGEQPQD